MAELVENDRVLWVAGYLFLILWNSLLVPPQACVGEAQMVVTELSFGIKVKSCLKLLNRLQSAIGILIGATQQYMCQGCGRLQLDNHFEFSVCRASVFLPLLK